MHDQWISSLNLLIDWIKTRSTVHKKQMELKYMLNYSGIHVFTKYTLEKNFCLVKSFTLFAFPGN